MTEPANKPIEVNPSASRAAGGTVLGALLIVITSFPTLLTLFSAKDLNAIRAWMYSMEGITFITAAGFLGTLTWRLSSAIRKHVTLLIAAREVDDSIMVVKGETPPAP
jgi:hypothetical protein